MEKEVLAILIAVAVISLVGFVADAELTGNWFKAPRMSSYRPQYRPPPVYSPPVQQAVQQQPIQPQIIPQQFFGTLVNNYINSQREKGFCLANCAPTLKGNCLANVKFMPAGTNCDAMLNPFIGDCLGKCNTKFPQATSWGSAPQQPAQQPQINPQQHLGTLVNNYINSQRERNFCLANCPMIIKSNCLANVKFMPAGTQCDVIASPFINDCIRRCGDKFPQVQQAPVQPVQQQGVQAVQDCAKKCGDGAALLYKQCMDQGAGEAACQNVGNLQKESCTRKCALGY